MSEHLEFWWELAALRDDHAARSLAGDEGDRPAARGAGALAELLPDDAEVIAGDEVRNVSIADLNDAPTLARADVGLAIGAGTDVAMESAGVVLASSDPRGVGSVVRLSRASYRKMVQNLVWAAGYNIVAIPLAAIVSHTP